MFWITLLEKRLVLFMASYHSVSKCFDETLSDSSVHCRSKEGEAFYFDFSCFRLLFSVTTEEAVHHNEMYAKSRHTMFISFSNYTSQLRHQTSQIWSGLYRLQHSQHSTVQCLSDVVRLLPLAICEARAMNYKFCVTPFIFVQVVL